MSTALLMMVVAGAMLPWPLSYLPPDIKKYEKDMEWNLTGTVGTIEESTAANNTRHVIEATWHARTPLENFSLHIASRPSAMIVKSDVRTPFLVNDDTLYYADYRPTSTGCTVTAVDLKSGEVKWSNRIIGLGPRHHSFYSNSVRMKIRGRTLVVYGAEADGLYIELIDSRNGETWANRGKGGCWFNPKVPPPFQIYNAPKTDTRKLSIAVAAMVGISVCVGIASELLTRRRSKRKVSKESTT